MATGPTREEITARVADLLRRAGDELADRRVRLLERSLPPRLTSNVEECARDAVARALHGRRKIVAVKRCREILGIGLREAVDWVSDREAELLAAPAPPGPVGGTFELRYGDMKRELDELCSRLHETGVGDADALIDMLRRELDEMFTDEDMISASLDRKDLVSASQYYQQKHGVPADDALAAVKSLARKRR